MFWVYLISSVLLYLLQPKTPTPQPGKIEAPTVQEGTPIGVLWGSAWIQSPIVAWFGDTRSSPIYVDGGGKK